MGLFLLDLIWPPTPEGRFVNTILFVLWGIGSAAAIKEWLRIARERAVLLSVSAQSTEEGEHTDSPLPDTLVALFENLGLGAVDPWRNPRTALGRRVRDLWHVRGVGR